MAQVRTITLNDIIKDSLSSIYGCNMTIIRELELLAKQYANTNLTIADVVKLCKDHVYLKTILKASASIQDIITIFNKLFNMPDSYKFCVYESDEYSTRREVWELYKDNINLSIKMYRDGEYNKTEFFFKKLNELDQLCYNDFMFKYERIIEVLGQVYGKCIDWERIV